MVHDVMIHSWDFFFLWTIGLPGLPCTAFYDDQVRSWTWELTEETRVFLGRLLDRIRDIGKDQACGNTYIRIGIGQDDECQYLHWVEYWENSISYLLLKPSMCPLLHILEFSLQLAWWFDFAGDRLSGDRSAQGPVDNCLRNGRNGRTWPDLGLGGGEPVGQV
jgi:hypothetical protein